MTLSIIIVNWNTRDYLRACLASIYASVKGISFEVVVVDNNSADASAAMVAREFPQARLIANPTNEGFAAANNRGYAAAAGHYIAILNPDTVVHGNVFAACIAHLETHSEVGAVTCRFLNPDGSFQQEYYRRFPRVATILCCYTTAGRLVDRVLFRGRFATEYYYRDKRFDQIESIDQPGATFLVIPRTLIERIGLFDEAFPIFFNDVDFARRVWQTGQTIVYLPDAVITHHGGKGVRQLGWSIRKHFLSGCWRYFKKHHGTGQAAVVAAALGLHFALVAPFYFLRKRIRTDSCDLRKLE